MPTTPVAFYLGTTLLGTSSITTREFVPNSHAMFCPTCGEIWGRIVVDPNSWHVHSAACERHPRRGVPDWANLPGCFTSGTMPSTLLGVAGAARALDILPLAVLRREFLLTAEFYHDDLLPPARPD
jgi:hypothetical protein